MTDKHRHITCTGERCELCDEMTCSPDLFKVQNLKLCPVCRYKLGMVPTYGQHYDVTISPR